jgi:hypothetical protein
MNAGYVETGDVLTPVVGVPNRSASIAKLAAALAKAQGEIEGASKDKTNPHFKSAYADLASVWDACRAALSKNEIAVIQTPSADGSKVTVETILAHSSGEWISDQLTMTAQDARPQAIGSCITYARRYALSAMVGVAPEDDDGNAASGRTNGGAEKVVATPQLTVATTAAPPPQLPEGMAIVTAVEATGERPWRANLRYWDGETVQVTIFAPMVRDLAVDCAQDGSIVEPKVNRSNQMTALKRWTPQPSNDTAPLTADQIPF